MLSANGHQIVPATSQASSSSSNQSHSQTQTAPKFDLLYSLADSVIVDNLIESYFRLYNTSYPIVHERTFRERHQNHLGDSADASWQIAFYIVLALGHWMTSSEAEHRRAPYFTAARKLVSAELLESGTVRTVQACLLMVSEASL